MTTLTAELEKDWHLTIDQETGLPKLPEGYVWQIFRNETGNGRGMIVHISQVITKTYQKRVVTGWLKSETKTVSYDTYVSKSKDFVYSSKNLAFKMRRIFDEFMDGYGEDKKIAQLIGTYPPKRIAG